MEEIEKMMKNPDRLKGALVKSVKVERFKLGDEYIELTITTYEDDSKIHSITKKYLEGTCLHVYEFSRVCEL